ncbi:ABC transporter substrate-binding protein [Occallatibacter savannae]|uniref:ABC transporter substrate-binding protein n=1 Tax=Occallatibacter savannae TaxID=1002691 RepID=UPI0013A5424C|nr:ABC transporter substrate-binding protein [Occallatibacter savannae]
MFRRLAISLLLAGAALDAGARTRPHYGGTLHVEIAGDPWERPTGVARRLVYDGLTQFDAGGALSPALAVGWEQDNNFHRWQFRLRLGVRFHDGTALTSAVVAASLATSCGSACPWDAVKAVGPLVIFTSDNPMPNLPALLASDQFLIALTGTGNGGTAAGTGPFQVTGFNNGVLSLAANENCWLGRPFADAIEIRVRRPVRDQWLDLGSGHADVVEVPAEQLRQAQQQRLSVISSPPITLVALELGDAGALANTNLRAAIAAAVDRSALYNVIFQKQGEVTASLLPQRMSGYSFLFPTERDLNKAQALRGGLAAGTLTMSADGDAAMQLAAQRIALNLRESGINVQMVPAGVRHADLMLRRFTISGNDPAAALERILWDAGQLAAVSEQSSADLYKRERTILENYRIIPLVDLPLGYASGPRVRDLRLRADGSLDLAGASLEDVR